MAIDFLQFLFNFIIAGFLLRYAQLKLANRSPELSNAIAFVH